MHLPARVALLVLAVSNVSYALSVTILGDTNRDGVVDDKDLKGRNKWTTKRGALFLANIGDTDQRCYSEWVPPVYEDGDSQEEDLAKEKALDLCNDASGNVQRNPKYLAQVKTLPIDNADLPSDATASVRVIGEQAASLTRIFVSKAGEWTYVGADYEFKADDIENGLNLGVDARDVRREGPDGWDGRAKIEFTVYSGGEKQASDSIALRVAPVMTHHHLQKAQKGFVTNGPLDLTNESGDWGGWFEYGPGQNRFSNEFAENVDRAGIDEPTFRFEGLDPWTQDFFETGFTSIPGPSGPVVLRIVIRSAQSYRTGGREAFLRLRSDTVGSVQSIAPGASIDSMGNLETVPPHKHNGVSYPAGRVIMGHDEYSEPILVDFFRAQEVQAPIVLDTSWLSVGHVDEFFQFLPANNERGWVLMADDPLAGLALIEQTAAKDSSMSAVSRPIFPNDPRECHYNETLADLLAYVNLTQAQQHAADYIQLNIDILKREVGLRDEEIFRVPGLHTNWITGMFMCSYDDRGEEEVPGDGEVEVPDDGEEQMPGDDSEEVCGWTATRKRSKRQTKLKGSAGSGVMSILEAGTPPGAKFSIMSDECCRVAGTNQTVPCDSLPGSEMLHSWALYPSAINSVVLSDTEILAPKQWGPVVDGVDVLEEAVSESYGKLGFNVTFQDNWHTHHTGMGSIHCGTNVWREADVKWWKSC
ncbi:protein-arginine deiminase (PAD) domain-containing protein [Sarocladium implicatum]|nr:protein-arginine deiminase (PAD) domain-containing protein [Sarocladium implicatum]